MQHTPFSHVLAPRLLGCLGLLSTLAWACTERTASTANPQTGSATTVPGDPLPEGHPSLPQTEPSSTSDHVGRAPRRLTAAQLQSSLEEITGGTWRDRRTLINPQFLRGIEWGHANTNMLEALAPTLGRPDYRQNTVENTDPSVTFTKLADDAARSACREGVSKDLAAVGMGQTPHLLRHLQSSGDTPSSNPDGARRTVNFMASRFWARALSDAEYNRFVQLFDAALLPADAGPAPTNADGWRAVCIAMASSAEFLTY